MSKTAFNSNSNVNPFTAAKEALAPEKVQEFLDSNDQDMYVTCKVKSTKGMVESHVYIRSSSLPEDESVNMTYNVHLNSKILEVSINDKVIKVPMKLIWGFLSIITSILDVCEKINDLLTSFGIRLENQLKKYAHEVKSSITVNGKTLLDMESELESREHSSQFKRVTVTRHGHKYQFDIDVHADLRGCLFHFLADKNLAYGWYSVKMDGTKSFRFLYSSK